MRSLVTLLLTGCTLGIGFSSPDANGLADAPGDLLSPIDLGADLTVAPAADLAPIDHAATDLAAADLASAADLAPRPARPSPIAAENLLPGDPGWRLTAPSNDVAGFADHQSYAPGDTVSVHAAASTATTITWELWRLGYYGGAGGRKLAGGGPVSIAAAAPAVMDSSTGMVHAPWATSFTLAAGALTGFYLVKLIAPASQSYVPFIVRGDGLAPIVWPVAFNTYQAYNAWGGTGLYNNTRSDWSPWHAYAVSFDRPFLQGQGAGQLFVADRDFITFAEGQGYDLDYLADSDFDSDGARSLIILQGHAEYWTAEQRQHLADAISAGINVMDLGANDIFWHVRYDSTRRVMTGYKEFADLDPDQAQKTTEWRLVGLPENALLGVEFGEWIWSSVPLRVDWSWIWSSAADGDIIPGLYGFEIDRRYDNGAEPAGVVEVGRGFGENHSGQLATGQATIYTALSGATVFASGTVSWSSALSAAGWWDPRVQQATHNLVARLGHINAEIKMLKLPDGQPVPDYIAGVQVSTVTSALTAPVALAAAPDGTILVADGDSVVRVTPAGVVTPVASGFSGPRGLAVAADGTTYVSDTGNFQIKKIVNGAVSVFAGSIQGFLDGKPGQFQQPMSIALTGNTLLVVDTWSQRIRSVAADGTVATLAGNGAEAVVDGPGANASFWFPFAIAAFPDGTAAVAESNDGLVRQIAADGSVSTFAGELGRTGWWDGPADSAAVSELQGLAARSDGALVLCDAASYRIRILHNGAVRTLAGGATSALVDGPGETAGFSLPRAAVFAADGSLYVADTGNHALRKITGSTF